MSINYGASLNKVMTKGYVLLKGVFQKKPVMNL